MSSLGNWSASDTGDSGRIVLSLLCRLLHNEFERHAVFHLNRLQRSVADARQVIEKFDYGPFQREVLNR